MSVHRVSRAECYSVSNRTIKLLVQDIQLGIGIVEDFVNLDVESVMFLGHCLHSILLVDTAQCQ